MLKIIDKFKEIFGLLKSISGKLTRKLTKKMKKPFKIITEIIFNFLLMPVVFIIIITSLIALFFSDLIISREFKEAKKEYIYVKKNCKEDFQYI